MNQTNGKQEMNHATNWIETINLTLARPDDSAKLYNLLRDVKTASSELHEQALKVSLYRNTKTRMNWIIHFQRDLSVADPGKTPVGKNVASIISQLGQVEHAVWKRVADQEAC